MTAATTPAEAVRQPRRGLTGGWSLGASLFVAPAVFLLAIFLLYPVVTTVILSFEPGLDNYIRLLTADPKFLDLGSFPPRGALFNNLLWVVFYTTGCIVAGRSCSFRRPSRRWRSVSSGDSSTSPTSEPAS
jgi:alpha-glucoside transport system permease protein